MWRVESDGVPNIIVKFEPPVIVIRLKLMEVSESYDISGLCKRLLELNSEQMISGAFALEGNNVIAVEVLQSANLDLNELQAAIEGITMTAVQNYRELSAFRNKKALEDGTVELELRPSGSITGGVNVEDPGFVF
jgi:hypothetical protein